MIIENEKDDGFITLKEASEHFGYAPDYIGQLIRQGKIEGKQVYANVAWMTTKEAILEYQQREKKKDAPVIPMHTQFVNAITTHMLSGNMSIVYRYALRVLILLVAIFAIFAFYLLSVALDHYLIDRANKNLEERRNEIIEQARQSNSGTPAHISHGVQ